MKGPAKQRGRGTDRQSAALKQLSALAFDLHTNQPRLDLGPQGTRILKELIAAANAGLWVGVVILAATLVDVCMHESAQFDGMSFAGRNGGENSAGDIQDEVFGLSHLTAKERRQLDILRARRNALVHYKGPVAGVSGSGDDGTALAAAAEHALLAIIPILENLERWG
tara:strand:+ start:156 stop:659 length:504 start_codon:yes stop_codon:yes gene_type:complete